ncbi:MAG: hypothetical protein Q9208_000592 [Pyrenodesmia sp. 3 TL-2023]
MVVPEPENHIARATDAALDGPEVGEAQFYPIGENEHGTVYSNVAPHERRDKGDVTYFPIAENEHGTVYSNVALSIEKRSGAGDVGGESDELEKSSDDYHDVGLEQIHKFMEEHSEVGEKGKREEHASLEKRDWVHCVSPSQVYSTSGGLF